MVYIVHVLKYVFTLEYTELEIYTVYSSTRTALTLSITCMSLLEYTELEIHTHVDTTPDSHCSHLVD